MKLEKQLGGTGTNIVYNASLMLEILKQVQDDKTVLQDDKGDGPEFLIFSRMKNKEVGLLVILTGRRS